MKIENVFSFKQTEACSVSSSKIPSYIKETYSQLQEDIIVESILISFLNREGRSLSEMFYIEIGANHPIETSNTYLFYRKYGASGILVEANSELVPALMKVRPRDFVLESAVSASNDDELAFNVCGLSELSSISRDHIDSFKLDAPVKVIRCKNIHINKFLNHYANRKIDYISIDVEGTDVEILQAFDFLRFRPLVVQCEPSDHYRSGMSGQMIEIMQKRDYLLWGRTEYNLIFIDSRRLEINIKQSVNTFDVFDTLITRKCIDPKLVFKKVEALFPFPGFFNLRIEAERQLSHGDYTLEDIYMRMSQIKNFSAEKMLQLMNFEMDIEFENAIPIVGNMNKVLDGDVLVSDMYLSHDFIMKLLRKCGLDKNICLIVTSHGKSKGYIWGELKAKYTIMQHLGDNDHSDIHMAVINNVPAVLTRIARLDPIEKLLNDSGLFVFAEFLREKRLAMPEKLGRRAYLQSHINFPILLASTILLVRRVECCKSKKILFSSRDCNLWLKLYEKIASTLDIGVPGEYFYTSRLVRSNPSIDYLAYFENIFTENALIVDLCGTGWSLRKLFELVSIDCASVFFLHKLPADAQNRYDKISLPKVFIEINAILEGQYHNPYLEMLNYAEHGQVIDVNYIGGRFLPLFDKAMYSSVTVNLVSEQRHVFLDLVRSLDKYIVDDIFSKSDDFLVKLIDFLYSNLSNEKDLSVYDNSHYLEDALVMHKLGLK